MPEENFIRPVEVNRDEDGYWYHPGIPNFDEDHTAYKGWLYGQQLKVVGWHMESDLESHPYWEEGAANCLGWEPEKPRPTTGSCSEFSIPRTARMCSGRGASRTHLKGMIATQLRRRLSRRLKPRAT